MTDACVNSLFASERSAIDNIQNIECCDAKKHVIFRRREMDMVS